jgi:hypothetical protein
MLRVNGRRSAKRPEQGCEKNSGGHSPDCSVPQALTCSVGPAVPIASAKFGFRSSPTYAVRGEGDSPSGRRSAWGRGHHSLEPRTPFTGILLLWPRLERASYAVPTRSFN